MSSSYDWKRTVEKKIRFMANDVWDGLRESEIDSFLNNFEEENKDIGLALLDMLIFYSEEQVDSIISNLIRLLERDIWISEGISEENLTSDEIKNKLDEIYNNMCFVPVDESDPSSSTFTLFAKFKRSNDVSRKIKYIDYSEMPLLIALQNKYFVFVDDIIGTGTQFSRFCKRKTFGKTNKKCLRDLVEKNKDRKFYYLALGGCQEGIEKIKEECPDFKIIVSEFFPKSMDIFDEKNEYWELYPDKRERITSYLREKENTLQLHDEFSKNIPVLFQQSRASNTALTLYWNDKSDEWKPLYKR